ncbi:MAG: hypothetical protein PHH26_03300 [Candidatus Thermoplasmatota archaeon]|nr:hypothetical protein [Candidatus Thermoplasmatota archaeon]
MADTLIREGVAYGSQPLSPVPEYWNGSSYEKVQGINGATRVINYNSAGETFTGASPGSVQLTATSTVAISGTVTAVISGTATVTISGNATVNVSTVPVVGSANNTWSASATISSGATSTAVDLQYCYNISYFGSITNTASITLNLLVSQDNSAYYTAATATITAGTSSSFHYSTQTAARYAKLQSTGVSAIITATIAGK